MKRLIYLLILIVGILPSCNNEDTTSPNTSVANIIAEVTGAVAVKYTGAGVVTTATLSNALVLSLGTSAKIDNKKYMLGVYIFFKDFQDKTGVFRFTDREGVIAGDYAVGTFDVGEGNNKKTFVSDSGQVEITQLVGTSVRGSFYFRAKEKTTGEIIEVKNGIIAFP